MKYHYYTKKRKKDIVNRVSVTGIFNKGKLHIGFALCNKKDQYNKKIGRAISEGRAEKNPQFVIKLSEKELSNPAKAFVNIVSKKLDFSQI